MNIKLTFDFLPVISVLLVLAAWFIPKFKDWFAKLVPEHKQLFMVGLLLLAIVIAVVLSLLGFVEVYAGPTWKEWVWYPLVDFVIALMTMAGIYQPTKYLVRNQNG